MTGSAGYRSTQVAITSTGEFCSWCTTGLSYWGDKPDPENKVSLEVGQFWVGALPREQIQDSELIMMIEILELHVQRSGYKGRDKEPCVCYNIWHSSSKSFPGHMFSSKVVAHWLDCSKAQLVSPEKAKALIGLWQCKDEQ